MPFLTSLTLVPYRGGEWRLDRPLIYEFPDKSATFTIPAGFTCDLESTPWYIRWLLPEDTHREPAAVVHDWLYRNQEYDRRLSDRIFRKILEEIGVPEATAKKLYMGVRLFGGKAWDENTARKKTAE